MVGEDDNIFRLWRLRTMALQVSLRILRPKQNVLFQMCYDRGFTVSHEELNQPLSAFVSVYGDRPLRRDLTVLVPSSDDPTGESNAKHRVTPAQLLCGSGALMQKPQHQLRLTACLVKMFVFFPDEPRVTADAINEFKERMQEQNVRKAILIVQYGLTSQAKDVSNIRTEALAITHFTDDIGPELQVLDGARPRGGIGRESDGLGLDAGGHDE